MEAVLNTKKTIDKNSLIKIFLILILLVTIIIPLIFVFVQLGDKGVESVIRNGLLGQSILNSIAVSLTTSLLAIIFSFILAFTVSRSNVRGKGLISVLITVPMLIPSIAHGMGLIILMGENGLLTNLFNTSSNIYGFSGIMLGSFMYSFPTAYLMFYDVLQYEDRMPYQIADVMGIPKWRQFINITLPYLKKPIVSIFFATFTLVFTDYGVPMMVGGKFMTLPLFMYNEVIGQLNFGAGALASIVLIIPALIACIFDMLFKDISNANTVRLNYQNRENKLRDIFAYIFLFICIILILFPIVSYAVIGMFNKYPTDMTFGPLNLKKLWDMGFISFLGNSIIIAMLTAIVGTFFGTVIAYFTARSKRTLSSNILHTLSLISLAIPGIVLGIAYLLMYRGTNFAQSIFILVIMNIVHFFSSPYLMCYNAFNKINGNYEVVAETLNIPKRRFFIDILFPEIEDTMLEMFSYMFVNSMVTISAVSFLANAKNMPLSLLINQLEGQSLLECAALVAVFILIINVIVKTTIYLIKRARVIRNGKI